MPVWLFGDAEFAASHEKRYPRPSSVRRSACFALSVKGPFVDGHNVSVGFLSTAREISQILFDSSSKFIKE